MEYVICILVVLVIGLAAAYFIEEMYLIAKPKEKVEQLVKDNHKLTDEERKEINKAYYKQVDDLRKEIKKHERKDN